MNMNRSGHSEVRDPDWYSRSADRAKLSPNTLDTESLQNSLTSLNFDSLTVADLDHYSVRSLPVMPSSSASIAAAQDAPWNESPRSLRTSRSRASSKPPPGVSALDHLQNSISSLAGAMPPVRNIITEAETEDDSEADLEGSFVSLRIQDLNEMDTTAHAGNVSRNHRSGFAAPLYPVSPQRSMQLSGYNSNPSSPQKRQFRGDSSYAGSSITSRGSMRYNNLRYTANNNEHSLSTFDDDDFEDDDNLEIIKLLRKQVDTLKDQLIAEQQKNQEQKMALQQMNLQQDCKSHVGKLAHDSVYSIASSSCFDCDSFGEEKEAECENKQDDGSVGSLSSRNSLNSVSKISTIKKLADAEQAIYGSIAALKVSLRKQQQVQEEHQAAAPVPIDVEEEHLLMDELVLCELEANMKVMQRVQAVQQQALQVRNEKLRAQSEEQAARIAELERQLKGQS
jgi:hypothetical protein